MPAPEQGLATIIIYHKNAEEAARLGDILRGGSYSVWTADNAETALKRAEEHSAELILADAIPGDDEAFSFCDKPPDSDDSYSRRPPIIITLPSGRTDHLQRAFEAGADEVIIKPVTEAELLKRVGMIFRLERLESELRLLSSTCEEL